LADTVLAVLVASVALLALVGVIQKGTETAVRARWTYVSVSAVRDIADSLSLFGTRGANSRRVGAVTVRWSPVGGRVFRFDAFAPDTSGTPRITVHADVSPPIP